MPPLEGVLQQLEEEGEEAGAPPPLAALPGAGANAKACALPAATARPAAVAACTPWAAMAGLLCGAWLLPLSVAAGLQSAQQQEGSRDGCQEQGSKDGQSKGGEAAEAHSGSAAAAKLGGQRDTHRGESCRCGEHGCGVRPLTGER